ncbi:hypothetical protein [Desmospora profundinema]|uniref:Uncharacterized protein n=1 Tax=Desmospora profundinema TaxID=1571184 RepID=A0ABU1IMC3_9BACL|nr:hypothetical protein [Desmospora profundinema]MDR6225928.1 hypothetical protein [Desmospora profundinema]
MDCCPLLPGWLNRFSCLLFSGFLALLHFTPVWLWVILLAWVVLAYWDRGIVRVSNRKEDGACSYPTAG